MARGTRITIAPGIYQDDRGIAVIAKVHGKQREKRFPLGTALAALDAARQALQQEERTAPRRKPAVLTLSAAIEIYLPTVTSMPSFQARAIDCRAWEPRFGHRALNSLTMIELAGQINAWLAAGVAASTINHRRQALRSVYLLIDPDQTPPIDGTQSIAPKPLENRDLGWQNVLDLVAAVPATKSGAILRVMAHTGYPPARIVRLTPAHFNAVARTVFLTGRLKGQGTKSQTLRLTQEGAVALQNYFVHFPEGGGVNKNSWKVAFAQAISTVNAERARQGRAPIPPPPHSRPYDLRHSFGAELYRQTHDLGAVAAALDVTLETAQRYTLGAVPEQVDKAIAAMDAAASPRVSRSVMHLAAGQGHLAAGPGPSGRSAQTEAMGADRQRAIQTDPEADGTADGARSGPHNSAKSAMISQSPKTVPSGPIGRLVPRKQPKIDDFAE